MIVVIAGNYYSSYNTVSACALILYIQFLSCVYMLGKFLQI